MHEEIGRKTPAGGAHIYLGQPNVFFVTVCAKDRVTWFATPEVQTGLVELWREAATAWRVGFYLLMPDHIHLFCAPYDLRFDIDQWIRFWKSLWSRQHPDLPGGWQRRGFHHRMRNRIEYEDKLRYVQENPLRHGLVPRMEDWAFQGRVHDVMWTGD